MKILGGIPWLCVLLIVAAGRAEESPDEAALAALVDNARVIEEWSSMPPEVARRLEGLRSEGHEFPILSGLGPVSLQMSKAEVGRSLGRERDEQEIEEGWQWSYPRRDGKRLVIQFDLSGRVARIFCNSPEFRIPRSLTVGYTLDEFSGVYGSRRFRHSTLVSRDLKLIKYPLSNLAIAVDRSNDLVRSLMVYRAGERPPGWSGG